MTAFAADAVGEVKARRPLVWCGIRRMTIEAGGSRFRPVDFEILGDLLRAGFEKDAVCLGMLVLARPELVFVLVYFPARLWPNGAMAVAGRA